MRLSDRDLYWLTQCAVSAACQAGQLIARHAQRRFEVGNKDGGTSLAAQVVTEVDHMSQALILKILQPSCEIFDLACLAEESDDDKQRLHKDFFWCIDPLDGTLPFIEAVPGYSVAIALLSRDGTPWIGVVYDPLTQTLYQAVKGEGAWRNEMVLQLPTTASKTLTFITDKSFAQDPLYQATLPALDEIALALGYAEACLKLQGGAALNACQVLNGSSCYFKFPKPQRGGGSVWDYAATACLFEEAGMPVSDMLAKPLSLNPEGATFMNHCGVLYSSSPAIAEHMLALYRRLDRDGAG